MFLLQRKTENIGSLLGVTALCFGLCWFSVSDAYAGQETPDTSCDWVCQPAQVCHWVRRCYMKRLCSPRTSCHLVQYYLLDDEGRKVLFRKNKCEVIQNCGYHNQCGLFNTCSLLPNCRAVCPPKVPNTRLVNKAGNTVDSTATPTRSVPPVSDNAVKPGMVRVVSPKVGDTSMPSKEPISPRVKPPTPKILSPPTVQTTCKLSLLERLLWFNLNQYRQQQKLPEFSCSGALSVLARRWGVQECQSKAWSILELQTNIRAVPLEFHRMDAFSAQGYSWRQAFLQWQQNPKQQQSLKQSTWSRIGVGVVACQQQFVWSVIVLP